MAVIAIYSLKGGVGKTTLAANLAWWSAQVSRRHTLLWDLDPQGGGAFLLGVDVKDKGKAAKAMASRDKTAKLIVDTPFKKLDILPADSSLWSLDQTFGALAKKKRLARLTSELRGEYERIILDCPPVMNETSAQILRAADLIIVPLPPSPLSTRALPMVRDHVMNASKKHPPILPVLSMFDARRKIHKELRADMPKWPVVPMASVVEQAAARRTPVGAFAQRSPAGEAFARLWRAIEKKISKL